jgi:hypothetical protein
MSEALKVYGDKGQQVFPIMYFFLIFTYFRQDRDSMTGKLIGIQGLCIKRFAHRYLESLQLIPPKPSQNLADLFTKMLLQQPFSARLSLWRFARKNLVSAGFRLCTRMLTRRQFFTLLELSHWHRFIWPSVLKEYSNKFVLCFKVSYPTAWMIVTPTHCTSRCVCTIRR